MKKTVALLLCCLLLAGSLIALAGGTCAHDGARDVETVDTEFGCWTLHYQKETCRRCGEETLTLLGREDDRHEGVQLLSIFNLIINRQAISLTTCILDAAWV